MKLIRAILFLLPLALLAWPMLARAVELKDYKVSSDEKKIQMSFSFSAALKDADLQTISNYQGNFVALKVAGLRLSKQQLKADVPPKDDTLKPFYRFLRFVAGEKGVGEVRIYLTKPVTPADVLVNLDEAKASVEIVKPWWKLKSTPPPAESGEHQPGFVPSEPAQPPAIPDESQPPADESAAPPAEGGFREVTPPEDTAQPPEVPAPESGAETAPGGTEPAAAPGTGGEGTAPESGAQPPEESANPDTAPASEDASARPTTGETYNQTDVGELFGHGTGTTPSHQGTDSKETPSGVKPSSKRQPSGEQNPAPGKDKRPGYTEFDLDQIPISGIEIRGLPFDEALLKLVASSGFNVVVGKDIEQTEVNLNFTQKQISLKNALDLLCIAYDLVYTVEPDAIVIKGKSTASSGP
jgi:hypothetical protein